MKFETTFDGGRPFVEAAEYDYIMPANIGPIKDRVDVAVNIGWFLFANTGSVNGYWVGKMRAADQRKILGMSLGKGNLKLDGLNECAESYRTVCFGQDSEMSAYISCKASGEMVCNYNSDRLEKEMNAARSWFQT